MHAMCRRDFGSGGAGTQHAFLEFCGLRRHQDGIRVRRDATPLNGKGNGGKGIRTPDIQLAKLALYQLSYAPAENSDCRLEMPDCKRVVLERFRKCRASGSTDLRRGRNMAKQSGNRETIFPAGAFTRACRRRWFTTLRLLVLRRSVCTAKSRTASAVRLFV